MQTKKNIFFIFLFLALGFLPSLAFAQTSPIIPNDCLVGNAEKCDLVDLVQMFANFYLFLVKYLGVAGLLLMVIGGVMFITSGGNQELITRARNILTGTVIGLAIVMGSYVIVFNLQKLIGVKNQYQLNPNSSNTTSSECLGKPDGANCSGPDGNVYVCINNICQNGENNTLINTVCAYNYAGNCLENCTTSCNGTCTPNLCNGGPTVQCCRTSP